MPKGATIPDPVNPAGNYSRVICIPGSPEWIAAVNGALYPLTQEWYWDASTGDAAAAALRAQEMYFQFQDQNGPCAMTRKIGEVIQHVSPTPDDGWLLCDGSQYERTVYPELAALIPEGTPNIGGDATYFLVPQMGGRVPIGAGATVQGSINAFSMGQRGGANTVVLATSDIPSHTHALTYGGFLIDTGTPGPMQTGAGLNLFPGPTPTGSTGGGAAHNNMQPYFALYYWIYAGSAV